MSVRSAALAFALSVSLLAPAAHAQANDAAAAQALFNEGKQLMTAKSYAAACPKFAESQRLDPGIGTMLWLAECHSKNGHIASAWALFQEAEALAAKTKDPRATVARDEARKLEPKLSQLVIDATAVSNIEGIEIKRDGVVLGKPLWGTRIPTDAGAHKISASAPGKTAWEGEVTVPATPGAASVAIPMLVDAPAPPVTPVAEAPAPVIDSKRGRSQRIFGLVVGGVGLVGIGVGAFFGLQTGSKNDESKKHCRPDDPNLCDAQGLSLRDDAKSAATLSTIGFIAGAALLAGGAVLYFTAPKAGTPKVGAAPLPGGGAFTLQGTF